MNLNKNKTERKEELRIQFNLFHEERKENHEIYEEIQEEKQLESQEKERKLTHPCAVCNENEGVYQPDSCHCRYSYCRKCAMKYGTGGRCIKCGNFYGSIRSSR